MLLRNLNSARGLCNGTRLTVEGMNENFIIAKVLSGKAEGQTIFIPRIDVIPTDTDLPFQLKRRQFPIMLASVMTINKSQGQSLDSVGIYLPASVFSHGQLYVAFSRARTKTRIKVKIFQNQGQGKLIPGSDRIFTKNVVYKEVFDTSLRNQNSVDDFELMEEYDELMLLHHYDQNMAEINNPVSANNPETQIQSNIPIPIASTQNTSAETEADYQYAPFSTNVLSREELSIIPIPLPVEATTLLGPRFEEEYEPPPDCYMSWYTGGRNVFDIHGNRI